MFFIYQAQSLAVILMPALRSKIEMIMETTTLNQTITTNYTERVSKPSLFTNFINWCKGQEENRLLWLGIALAGHGCILTPLTVMAVLLAGNNIVLFMLAIIAMAISLVTNLAAMPTKVTIPAFIFSILVDLGILVACIATGFNVAGAFK